MSVQRWRRSGPGAPRIFISLAGEFPNVGDGVIRRLSQEWVREAGPLDVYVGEAPASWITQVGVTEEDRLHQGSGAYGSWLFRCLTSRGRPTLILEPGEVSLTRWHFPRQVLMLLVVVGLRLRGGTLLLPPRAVTRRREATPWAPTVAIHRTLCRLAQVCLWRDEFSRKLIGEGEVVPDIAFSASSPASGLPVDQRTDLVVSLRGKRSEPSPGWFSTVARFADESGLRICTLAQVAGDVSRAQEVAARFPGAVMHPWDDDHLTQEGVAMSAYSRARIVISDRLHVLILASICGAIPVEIVSEPATKVRTHFETIGYRGASHDFQGDEDSALNFLRRTMARQDELSSALVSARVALLEARESFTKHLRTRATQ